MSPSPPPLRLLVAAAPSAPGVLALLEAAEAAAQAGGTVAVFWTDDGLEALPTEWPARLFAAGARCSLCARSARARGVEAASVPATVPWSSLTAFLRDLTPTDRLWSAFP